MGISSRGTPQKNGTGHETQAAGADSLTGKFLTFRLAGEEYGIGILKVREIIGLLEITLVPRMPSFVRGVINLRGKVIPVIDLRLKFSMPGIEDTKQTCIIVVEVRQGDLAALVGILVDTVSEVVNINDSEIDRALSFGSKVNTTFILGVAKVKGSVKILLDIDKILGLEELSSIANSNG
ncbi:MAG: purine-binding chemotaxis protein CheW [Candidatus Riflebacteria bacterium]|nr:purine-binding chemotaxis protein CheW [Candidatus Riflebacteria bacterium]